MRSVGPAQQLETVIDRMKGNRFVHTDNVAMACIVPSSRVFLRDPVQRLSGSLAHVSKDWIHAIRQVGKGDVWICDQLGMFFSKWRLLLIATDVI
jgi:hypothetical protein